MNKKVIILLLMFLFLPKYVFAEIIVLKSGKTIQGKVHEKTDKSLKIDVDGMYLTYYFEDIESIDGKPALSPNQQATPVQSKVVTENQNPSNEAIDHKDIFEKRLSKALTLGATQNVNEKELASAIDDLVNFSKEYTDSEFASDAQVMPVITSFFGSSDIRKIYHINKMKEICNKYPDGKLTDFTCKKMMEFLKQDSPGFLIIPYKYLLIYMKGELAMDTRDFQSVITNFSLLKENIDFNKDPSGGLTVEIYSCLGMSYKSLGKMEELTALAKEASERFPDNIKLIQGIKKITAK